MEKKNRNFLLQKDVSLNSQTKVRFREYFEYFLIALKYEKKTTIRKAVRTLILHRVENTKTDSGT